MKILGTIQNELDAVNKQYVDGIIEGYLPLSGGTITATDSWMPLTLKSSDESRSFLRFLNKNDTVLGAIGCSAQGELSFYNAYTGGITRLLDENSTLQWSRIANIPTYFERTTFDAAYSYHCCGDNVLYRNTDDGPTFFNRGPAINDNADLFLYARNYIWFMINNEEKVAMHEGNVVDYVKSSFYTKTESDSKYLERKSYFMMPLFTEDNGPKLETSYLANALYAGDQRFVIDYSGFEGFYKHNLFNEEYDGTAAKVAAGTTATFSISNNGSDIINGTPYGDIYISFYYHYTPASVTVEAYCNFEAHGIGWHTLELTEVRGSYNGIYRFRQPYHMITHLRVTITARNDLYTELAEVAWNLSRTSLGNLPAVTKFNTPQTLYGEMTFNNKVMMDNTLTVNNNITANKDLTTKGNTTIEGELSIKKHLWGNGTTQIHDIGGFYGATPVGGSYNLWSIFHNGTLYIQSASSGGISENGNITLSGAHGKEANIITLSSAYTETSSHLKVKGVLYVDKFISGGENTEFYNIAGIYSRKPTDGAYYKWRIFEYYGGLVFQVASADGLSTAGKLYFQGFNNSPAELIAFKATDISFEGTPTFSGAIATFNSTAKVTGAAQTPLSVAATSNVGSFIAFTDVGNGTLGSLGVSADRKPTFITYSGATHELLHKNNLDSCNVSINFYDLSDYHDANLSQAEMNSFGLTTAVINNLKDGKYNKVLDTRDTQVWDYTVDGDKISFKCCDKEVMITKESDGTWYIEFL